MIGTSAVSSSGRTISVARHFGGEMARPRRRAGEDQSREHEHAADLHRHEGVVRTCAGFHAESVDGGEHDERRRRSQADASRTERHERAVHITAENDGDRRERSAVDDEEQRESVEEPDDRRVVPRQIHVLAAHVREARAQLGPDVAAQDRHDAADAPGTEDQERRVENARDVGRIRENTDTDDAADDDDGGIEETQLASEFRWR